MQKWEYARIMTDRGDVGLTFSHRETPARAWPRVINAMHDLGEDGWELVTASNRDGNEILHFRRPLRSDV